MGQTEMGVILGTAAYMSPEQAKGKPVDRRSDLYAFGLVLYEMVTGKRLHQGETTTEVLASVIKEEPNWERVPVELRKLLRRCLEKDPQKRQRHIGDVMALVEQGGPGFGLRGTSVPPPGRRLLWPGVAAVSLIAAVVLGFLYLHPKSAPAESTRFEIAPPPNVVFYDTLALSPDGRKLAFGASSGGTYQLWVRSFDAVDARPLAGTTGANGLPFWSADGRYIVFSTPGKLQKIEASGGPVQTLCAMTGAAQGGFWTRDNKIVFGTSGGLLQVSAAGGAPSKLTSLSEGEVVQGSPTLLPDSRHFLYTRVITSATGGVYLGSLDAKPEDQAAGKLLPDVSAVVYVPSADVAATANGYVLFARDGTLMAQQFDDRRLDMTGEAVPIAERVSIIGFSASANGTLVYRASAPNSVERLTWFDRKGASLRAVGDPSTFDAESTLALSPDGKRVAFARTDIWLYEFARGVTSRFTFGPGRAVFPVWSPDGSRIAFAWERGGVWGIYQKASNLAGGEDLLYKSGARAAELTSWSADGRFLLYAGSGGSPDAIWMLPTRPEASSGTSNPQPQVLVSESRLWGGLLSPDGRYFAYVSGSSGKDEVYVRPFDGSSSGTRPPEGISLVSKDGGGAPKWRGDGKEIFYRGSGGNVMSVEVSTTPVFQAGVPKPLFKDPGGSFWKWDVTADGQRFLFAAPVGENSAAPYTVVLNWQAALKR
jgi:eukaryotic-like serine/threonine-protein kinase